MIPVVTPSEMAAIDAAAPEGTAVLVSRAGAAVAGAAIEMLSDAGRRVVVLAGGGNNGADGRAAAARLESEGADCVVLAPDCGVVPSCDLLIDAAYGTGLNRPWSPPAGAEAAGAILAVDSPSGVDGLTGEVRGGALAATRTVTFAALKPGLLIGPGRCLAGAVSVADIGLDVSGATAHLMTEADVAELWPRRPRDAHKWRSACWVVAGSRHMRGAAALASLAALRSGAGYVCLSTPGAGPDASIPTEAVYRYLPHRGWFSHLNVDRFKSLVVGPGLGRHPITRASVRALVSACEIPMVLDGDALALLGTGFGGLMAQARAPVVLTPHDGEFELLMGRPPGPDRLAAARTLAGEGATVVLKGPTTVVAGPDGQARLVTSGDARLATAGTGDVLAGMVGALLAQGLAPLDAASLAAQVHGMAGSSGPPVGLIAGDLPAAIPNVLSRLLSPEPAAGG